MNINLEKNQGIFIFPLEKQFLIKFTIRFDKPPEFVTKIASDRVYLRIAICF